METTEATISSPVSYVIADFKVLFVAGKHHYMHQAIAMSLSLSKPVWFLELQTEMPTDYRGTCYCHMTEVLYIALCFPILKRNMLVHKPEHLLLPLQPPSQSLMLDLFPSRLFPLHSHKCTFLSI